MLRACVNMCSQQLWGAGRESWSTCTDARVWTPNTLSPHNISYSVGVHQPDTCCSRSSDYPASQKNPAEKIYIYCVCECDENMKRVANFLGYNYKLMVTIL